VQSRCLGGVGRGFASVEIGLVERPYAGEALLRLGRDLALGTGRCESKPSSRAAARRVCVLPPDWRPLSAFCSCHAVPVPKGHSRPEGAHAGGTRPFRLPVPARILAIHRVWSGQSR
jgi:hypothetical protein